MPQCEKIQFAPVYSIATCYAGSPIANTKLSLFDHEPIEDKTTRAPHKIEIVEVEDYNQDGAIDLADVEYLLRNKKNALTRLKGDGDFRSAELLCGVGDHVRIGMFDKHVKRTATARLPVLTMATTEIATDCPKGKRR